eukprot:27597-Chlamydomonas_euryale.AAC.5
MRLQQRQDLYPVIRQRAAEYLARQSAPSPVAAPAAGASPDERRPEKSKHSRPSIAAAAAEAPHALPGAGRGGGPPHASSGLALGAFALGGGDSDGDALPPPDDAGAAVVVRAS